MNSINCRLADAGFRSPELDTEHPTVLKKRDFMLIAVRAAFPLPETGAFTDLLAAIDGGQGPPS